MEEPVNTNSRTPLRVPNLFYIKSIMYDSITTNETVVLTVPKSTASIKVRSKKEMR